MSRVYMIRHGKPASTWGDQVTDLDPGLDITGQDQAKAAAETLLAFAPGQRPIAVVTSPLRRCEETAAPLIKALGLDVVVEPAVAEIPTPSSLTVSERPAWLRRAFAGTWGDIEGEIDYKLWKARVAEAVIRHAGGAIFTHFVAINAAVSAATGDDRVLNFQPDHASITVFDVTDGVLTLVELGRAASTSIL